MANRARFKSARYPGVYWQEVERPDKRGLMRVYYIIYRRPGSRKQIEERLPIAGMTEARANQERAKRIAGAKSNNERRQAERERKAAGMTLDLAWQRYRNDHAQNRSIRDDINRYARHIAPALANVAIASLATSQITSLRASLEKAGLSPQTVKHCLGLIKRVINYGASIELFPMPPNLRFQMPTVSNQKTENMTDAQLAAYWRALNEEPDQEQAAFFKIALLTGLRAGAICGLRWDDIDFEAGRITLRPEFAKNGRVGHIPLNAAAAAVLDCLSRTSEFVFPGKSGGKRQAAPKMGRRLREKAGLPADFRPCHGLRHTFASHLASSGSVTIYEIQHLLTHNSPQVTQRYAHLADEALARAASVANGLAPEAEGK